MKKICEAIILAGGLGTRLRSISGELPKPMVEVAGQPFIFHIFEKLIQEGINRVILAVSYRSAFFEKSIGNRYKSLEIIYSVEESPLGTGGGIVQALKLIKDEICIVVNGDTYCDFKLDLIISDYVRHGMPILIGAVEVDNVFRYGQLKISDSGLVQEFVEKGNQGRGFINAGIYVVPSNLPKPYTDVFSFESDYLHNMIGHLSSSKIDGYFIDIGIPSDFQIACEYFS